MTNTIRIEKLDRLIFGFVILFASTVNNSIFFSQLGFFGAYILVGVRYFLNRENPFSRTEIDEAFLFYYFIVFLAAIFSVEAGNAFIDFFKNIVLLPIIYLLIFVANTNEKAKAILKFYLGAALATLIVYLFFSLKHYFTQSYQLELKGPSPFQYVMTAGGLMSFTAVYYFAFFINEKTGWKMKLFFLFGFALSFSAVIASYTRAAWLGLFAGIIIVLILKKKWWIILPTIVAIIVYIFSVKSESKIEEIQLVSYNQSKTINTIGRPYSVKWINTDTIMVAEYENGITLYSEKKQLSNIKLDAPVTRLIKWNNEQYLAYTLQSKFYVIEKQKNNKLKIVKSFISPGSTRDFSISSRRLYVADKDSGLTIYSSPFNIDDRITNSSYGSLSTVSASEKYIALYSDKSASIILFTTKNGAPYNLIDTIPFNSSIKYLWLINNNLFFQNDNSLIQYSINDTSVTKLNINSLVGITRLISADSKIYALTISGKIYEGIPNTASIYSFKEIIDLKHPSIDFDISDNSIYVSSFKRNRISSIFDPNHETNYERMNMWRVGFRIFLDHPILGVGDIDLGNLYRKYKPEFMKENFGHLHNNFIHWLVTLGIIGFSVIMFLIFKILSMHLKIFRELKEEPIASSFALGSAGTFIGFLASGMGEYNFGDQEIYTMVLFAIGLNIAFYLNYKKEKNIL